LLVFELWLTKFLEVEDAVLRKEMFDMVRDHFSPEFINRIGLHGCWLLS
jgi:ATP-dependent Clp protease ATP-binding subunit ClpA